MTPPDCPNCGRPGIPENRRFCPHCGALLGLPAPGPEERKPDALRAAVAQKQKPAPIKTNKTNMSPGPLLTGSIILDASLGFLGEMGAVALILYGLISLIRALDYLNYPDPNLATRTILWGVGAIASGALLLWHTQQMRKQYMMFSRGWQTGRHIYGIGMNIALTLLFGVAVLIVLFPLGALVLCVAQSLGVPGWIGGVVLTYLLGLLARRMNNTSKPKQGSLP